MDFIDELKQLSKRVESLKDKIPTEEATKTSMIMPFFQILGYDVFDPSEFFPEFTADVGIKKGEKVDYAIMKEEKPIILIEAKWCGESLDKHGSQLFRYFGTTSAKFGILTNGLIYRFYTDLDEQNKMDEKPFLEVDLLDFKDWYALELKKFHKKAFDVQTIFDTASELKYSNEIKQFMAQQLRTPSDDFIRYILTHVYSGVKTQNVVDKFRDVVKKSLNNYINELMNEKITSALKSNETIEDTMQENEQAEPEETINYSRILTTDEEMEAYHIVRHMAHSLNCKDKITYKDTESYFGILFDNNTRKWICRVNLDGNNKYLYLPTEDKKQDKFLIENIDDLYKYEDKVKQIILRYSGRKLKLNIRFDKPEKGQKTKIVDETVD